MTAKDDFHAMADLEARTVLLRKARDHLKRATARVSENACVEELAHALDAVVQILGLVQRSDESIMLVHRECQAMIEHSQRVIDLFHRQASVTVGVTAVGGAGGSSVFGGGGGGGAVGAGGSAVGYGGAGTAADTHVDCAERKRR